MEYSAILHDMDKRFCYAIDKDLFVIRVQVKKDDIKRSFSIMRTSTYHWNGRIRERGFR